MASMERPRCPGIPRDLVQNLLQNTIQINKPSRIHRKLIYKLRNPAEFMTKYSTRFTVSDIKKQETENACSIAWTTHSCHSFSHECNAMRVDAVYCVAAASPVARFQNNTSKHHQPTTGSRAKHPPLSHECNAMLCCLLWCRRCCNGSVCWCFQAKHLATSRMINIIAAYQRKWIGNEAECQDEPSKQPLQINTCSMLLWSGQNRQCLLGTG